MLKSILRSVVLTFQKLGGLTLFFMMFLTTLNIISRFFGKPIHGTYDLTQLAMVVVFFSSLGFAQITKSNISIDFFMMKASRYLRDVIDFINYTIFLILITLMLWQILQHAKRSLQSGHVSIDLQLPYYYFIYFAAIGIAILVAVIVNDCIETYMKVRRKNET